MDMLFGTNRRWQTLLIAILGLPIGSNGLCQSKKPVRKAPPPVPPQASTGPTTPQQSFEDVLGFIKSKADGSIHVVGCVAGFDITTKIEGLDNGTRLSTDVRILPLSNPDPCHKSFLKPWRTLSYAIVDPKLIEIGSIRITTEVLAREDGSALTPLFELHVPLLKNVPTPAGEHMNSFIHVDRFAPVPYDKQTDDDREIRLYFEDESTALRVKNALVALAKLRGAKEELF